MLVIMSWQRYNILLEKANKFIFFSNHIDSEISRSIPFSRSDHLLVPTRSPPIFRTRISKSSRETSAQLRTFVR